MNNFFLRPWARGPVFGGDEEGGSGGGDDNAKEAVVSTLRSKEGAAAANPRGFIRRSGGRSICQKRRYPGSNSNGSGGSSTGGRSICPKCSNQGPNINGSSRQHEQQVCWC